MTLFDNMLEHGALDGGADTDADQSASDDHVLTVSDLTRDIKTSLQDRFSSVWVTGEISDLARPNSGHVYFTLKDDQSQIRAVIWRNTVTRLRVPLDDGLEILCRGDIDVYPPRGTYQLIIRHLEPRGEGALQAALRKLRAKLDAEGLFEPALKKPIPSLPRRIGVITSPSGAALRDFLQVAARRWRGVQIVIIPSRVQGVEAAAEIVAAIETAHDIRPKLDALVVTRGGGSIEDLWSFNEEKVVRAIFAAELPVISAVGHEIDVTLADLVADLRALTPSEAAERVIPSADELQARLEQLDKRLQSVVVARFTHARSRLDALASRRVLRHPDESLRLWARRVDELQMRASRAISTQMTRQCERLAAVSGQLESLSPLSVLRRGYSLTSRDDRILDDAVAVNAGDIITTRLARGEITSRVESINPSSPESPVKVRESDGRN
jgi:exodeoxyribonuclease VII large subunit